MDKIIESVVQIVESVDPDPSVEGSVSSGVDLSSLLDRCGSCGVSAVCSVELGSCVCLPGHTGDPYVRCNTDSPCGLDNICGANAECSASGQRAICRCR